LRSDVILRNAEGIRKMDFAMAGGEITFMQLFHFD